MINKSDLTILIQGPTNRNSLETLPDYIKYADNIILSTWNTTNDLYPLEYLRGLDNIKIVSTEYPSENELKEKWNKGFLYYQNKTAYEGIKCSKTKYTLKVRSDSSYPVLDKLLENLELYPDKIHTNNIWFRPNYVGTYHISTHILLGKTDILSEIYKRILYISENYMRDKRYYIKNDHIAFDLENSWFECGVEPITGYICMEVLGETPLFSNSVELMKKHIHITPTYDLPNCMWGYGLSYGEHKFESVDPSLEMYHTIYKLILNGSTLEQIKDMMKSMSIDNIDLL